MTFEEVCILALKLPLEERELLGIELLSSLRSAQDAVEIDEAWSDEIRARSDAYRNGFAKFLDADGTPERLCNRMATRNAL